MPVGWGLGSVVRWMVACWTGLLVMVNGGDNKPHQSFSSTQTDCQLGSLELSAETAKSLADMDMIMLARLFCNNMTNL